MDCRKTIQNLVLIVLAVGGISLIAGTGLLNVPKAHGESIDGVLADLWAGTAYFETQAYVTPAGSNIHEVAPVQVGTNTIYMYYRTYKNDPTLVHGEIALAVSTDGGASFSLPQNGSPVVKLGTGCDFDSWEVIAPSVLRVDSTHYYMVYEGRNADFSKHAFFAPAGCTTYYGEIGWAFSSDGVNWTKNGILIDHNSDGWELGNIGTPFVGYFNSKYYVFYHGFDGARSQIGFASGTSLCGSCLTKSPRNPVITNPTFDHWDNDVDTRASVIYDGSFYYMTFEGSSSWDCSVSTGHWGWGIARTTNLDSVPWEKYPYNPIRQSFNKGCGNDLPYIFLFNGMIKVYQREYGVSNVLLKGYTASSIAGSNTTVQDPYLYVWPASSQCLASHQVGELDGTTWAAHVGDGTGYMCEGPTAALAGNYDVNFRQKEDVVSCIICESVINDGIWNNTAGSTGAFVVQHDISRPDFLVNDVYNQYDFQFSSVSGPTYQFTTYYYNKAYIHQQYVFARRLDASRDTQPPFSNVFLLPGQSTNPVPVSWGGGDDNTGIWSFDIQTRDATSNGAWTDWILGTTSTSASFTGQTCFHSYEFRSRARDNAGNVGQYPDSSQASTTISCDSFSISSNPSIVTLAQGSSTTSTVTLTSINGYAGNVYLSSSQPVYSTPALDGATSGYCHSTSSTQCTTAGLSTKSAGDLIVAFASSPDTLTTGFRLNDSAGLTYISRTLYQVPYGNPLQPQVVSIQEFWAWATPTLTSDRITMTTQDPPYCCPGHNLELIAFGVSSSGGPGWFDGSPSTASQSNGSPAAQVSTAGPHRMIIGYAVDGVQNLTPGPGFTLIANSGNDGSEYMNAPNPGTSVSVSFGGSQGQWAEIADAVQPAPGFSISLQPQTVPLAGGGSSTSNATIKAAGFVPFGTYTIGVTGTTGFSTHSTGIVVNVMAPDFSLCCSNSYSLPAGGAVLTTGVNVNSLYGFSGPVNLQLSATLVGDTTISLSPTSVTLSPGQTSSSTLTITSGSQTGTYSFTVKGTSGTLTHSVSYTLTVTACCSGGGGSVAYGTLITMADGSNVPVQNLKAGDQMLGYNTATNQFTISSVTAIKTVVTSNMLIIHTAEGTPFRVDANPAQTLWVKTSSGQTGWLAVTQVKVGDYLFTVDGWTPVTGIEFAPAGQHIMYDITSTMPYFASGYLDPIHKL